MADSKSKSQQVSPVPPARKDTPPFEAIRAFDAVARLRGIRKAARSLHRDHAVISRHLKAMEAWVGTLLLERTPNGMILTEDGRRYHKEISAAMDSIANATIDLMRRGDDRHLHLRCPPAFALHWISPRLALFEKEHPNTEVQLRPVDRLPDFASHDTDIDIQFISTYGPPLQLVAGLRSERLAQVPVIAVASPAYLERATSIEAPEDLLNHRLLHEVEYNFWVSWLAAHEVYCEVVPSGIQLWQGHLTLAAAIHGRGVALMNKLVAAEEIASGRLVEIGKDLDSFKPYADGTYYLISRADRWDAPIIRYFRLWLKKMVADSNH